jgi:ABC-type transport system substrate-binding protein/class 3 adenylate cyclase/tRNA A-37 threonylcarbamoyl transferase component Bud32
MSGLDVGAAFAGYRIESLIGDGSSGTVYAAQELSLQRRVALKILLPELARDDRFRERFLRESRLAASLEHPSIIPIYAAGEADGLIYLAMRFVEGSDLGRLIESEGALDAERSLAILAQVGDALDAAHRRGLVHRDVKPANILVDQSDRTYLCDFGLARHAATVNSLSRDDPFAGTIDYIAPEQIHGDEIDARTDVYALGCVLFESLAGSPPFRRATEVAAVLAHLNEQPPSLHDLRPELPAALDDVVRRALAKSPDERYATAGELVDDARGAAGGADGASVSRTPQLRTFLIADVRGYTRYTQEHGDEAGAELAATFAQLVRDVVSKRDGRLLELRGDEALVVFESARKALQAAVELQAQVAEAELPRGVGIGVDAGEAVPVGRGYRGAALNTAARLCSRARAGEVLASEGVVHLAGKAEGVAYGLRRQERLKGYDKPVAAFEIHPSARAPRRELGRRALAKVKGTRPRLRALVAAASLALAAVAAIVLTTTREAGGAPFAAKTVGVLDARSGKTRGAVDTGSTVGVLIPDQTGFWTLDPVGSLVQHIDARTRSVSDQFAIPEVPYWIAPRVAFGALWGSAEHEPALLRIDLRYRRVAARIPLPVREHNEQPQGAQGVAVTDDAVWVLYGTPKRIARVDPQTNEVTLARDLPQAAAWQQSLVAAGGGMLWAIDRNGHRFARLDPKDGSVVAQGRLHDGVVEDAAVLDGYLWAPMQGDGGVWKIDGTGAVVGKVATGNVPYALALGKDALWVANSNGGTVTRIDPQTNATRQYRTGHRPSAIGVRGDEVWVYLDLSAADARARITGKKIVTAVSSGDPYSVTDSATYGGETAQLALSYATGARLMDARVAAGGTTRIVPDVAAAPPSVTNGGRTYVFRIRKGFGFSPPAGEAVTAETFRYTLERTLSPVIENSYCRDALLTDVVGEQAYLAGKAQHISGIVAAGDRLRITLVAPSLTLPARLAMPCFSAVPIGTPATPNGIDQPIPSAGPYFIDSHIRDEQLVVRKNPNYGGDRAQPIDAFVNRQDIDSARGGALVAQGKADYVFDHTDPFVPAFAPGGRYQKLYGGSRYFFPPSALTRFLSFNTLRGPFHDVRLRRAVALAIDRTALAAVEAGRPASLLLPPGIPGYQERTVYPATPQVARARKLVGKRRVPVVLASQQQSPQTEMVSILRKDLARVGIDLHVRYSVAPWTAAKDPHSGIDALLVGWTPDYPDPFDVINVLLDPRDGLQFLPPWFTDVHWLAQMRAAARATGPVRAQSFAALDFALARGPVPMLALDQAGTSPQLFSARIRCHTFLPQLGGIADIASLCLR